MKLTNGKPTEAQIDKLIEKIRQQNGREMTENYLCPHCGFKEGWKSKDDDIIKTYMCPNCGTELADNQWERYCPICLIYHKAAPCKVVVEKERDIKHEHHFDSDGGSCSCGVTMMQLADRGEKEREKP